MVKKIIKLNESEFKSLIKNVINEMVSEYDVFDNDTYSDDDEWDDSVFNIPDIKDVTGKKVYNGEFDKGEFTQEEEPEDTDVNNNPDRDVIPDEMGDENDVDDEVVDNNATVSRQEITNNPIDDEDEEPGEYNEGDVFYYYGEPIKVIDGRFELTSNFSHETKRPSVTIVSSDLEDLKNEYHNLKDVQYRDAFGGNNYNEYIKILMKQGIADYDFGNAMLDNGVNINLENLPIIIDLDKKGKKS